MQYDNKNTFALFKHDKKGNEKAPDYSGYIYDGEGVKRRIACWLRDGKNGKFMSGKMEDYQDQEGHSKAQSAPQTEESKDDGFDSIPF